MSMLLNFIGSFRESDLFSLSNNFSSMLMNHLWGTFFQPDFTSGQKTEGKVSFLSYFGSSEFDNQSVNYITFFF